MGMGSSSFEDNQGSLPDIACTWFEGVADSACLLGWLDFGVVFLCLLVCYSLSCEYKAGHPFCPGSAHLLGERQDLSSSVSPFLSQTLLSLLPFFSFDSSWFLIL